MISISRLTDFVLRIMNGWLICDLGSFLTVFQSYQADGWMIMKGCMQCNPVYGKEDFVSSWAGTRDT